MQAARSGEPSSQPRVGSRCWALLGGLLAAASVEPHCRTSCEFLLQSCKAASTKILWRVSKRRQLCRVMISGNGCMRLLRRVCQGPSLQADLLAVVFSHMIALRVGVRVSLLKPEVLCHPGMPHLSHSTTSISLLPPPITNKSGKLRAKHRPYMVKSPSTFPGSLVAFLHAR